MTKEIETTGLDAQPIGIFSNSRISSQDHFVDLTSETIREIIRYGPRVRRSRCWNGSRRRANRTIPSRHTVLRCRSA